MTERWLRPLAMPARAGLPRTVLVALVLLAGCSGGGAEGSDERPEAPRNGDRLERVLEPGRDHQVAVAPGLTLTVPAAAVADETLLSARPAVAPEPLPPAFAAVADPVELSLSRPLSGAVTMTFDGANAPPGSVPVVFRHDEKLGWHPVATGDPSGQATGSRSTFSIYVSGFLDAGAIAGAIGRDFRGRAPTGPTCPDPPPEWATVNSPALDRLLACGTSNPAPDGAERVEARIVSNRDFVQQVRIPPGADYSWVDGQPDLVRAAVRKLTGGDNVLLAPGQLMTIGYRQPAATIDMPVNTQLSSIAAALDLVLKTMELVGPKLADLEVPRRTGERRVLHGFAQSLALVGLAECSGGPQGAVLERFDTALVADAARTFARCLFEEFTDPLKAHKLAVSLASNASGLSIAMLEGDRAFQTQLENVAGGIRTAATAVKAYDLLKVIHSYAEFDAEELFGDSSVDSAAVPIHMTRRLPPVCVEGALRRANKAIAPGYFRCVGDIAVAQTIDDRGLMTGDVTMRWSGAVWKQLPPGGPVAGADITIDGFGAARFGLRIEEVVQAGYRLSIAACGTGISLLGGPGAALIQEHGGRVDGMIVSDPAWRTPSGVHVGSTLAELRAAYGANLRTEEFEGNVGRSTAWVLHSPQAEAAPATLWFSVDDNGRVHNIALIPKGATMTGMLC